eukprot:CAMPEP_0197900122 /NCGR_PEP_ID=MMETSP1439-20131203/48344_1 /TAXON_ID=66791 /ORGANISM="Gonyaulax spinifera, Strain CCMP409" /LENGTH=118 /DNA_ID=CAMNT_0043520985 /DNA_START=40 /DNA_END=396 /DNA_ORIENTATION=+
MPKTKSAARKHAGHRVPVAAPADLENTQRGEVSVKDLIAREKERQKSLRREMEDLQRACQEMVQARLAARLEAEDLSARNMAMLNLLLGSPSLLSQNPEEAAALVQKSVHLQAEPARV